MKSVFISACVYSVLILSGTQSSAQQTSPLNSVPQLPDAKFQVTLIKNALLALNQANLTGNYSVLYELCSPDIKKRVTLEQFGAAFKTLTNRSYEMSAMMELKPIPTQQPIIRSDGRMILVGYFPTSPQVLHYNLVFLQTAKGDWWIDGIVVEPKPIRRANVAPNSNIQQVNARVTKQVNALMNATYKPTSPEGVFLNIDPIRLP